MAAASDPPDERPLYLRILSWSGKLLDHFVFVVTGLAAPISCILLAAIILWFTDQFGEILLSTLTDPDGERRLYRAVAVLDVGGAISTYYASAMLSGYGVRNYSRRSNRKSGEQAARRSDRILNWKSARFAFQDATLIYRYAPTVLGLAFIGLPLLVITVRFYVFTDKDFLSHNEITQANTALLYSALGTLPGVALVALLGLTERMATHIARYGGQRVAITQKLLMLIVAPATVASVYLGIVYLLWHDPWQLASKYGALTIFAAVLWCYCVFLMIASELGQRYRFPFVWVLVIFIIGCGLTGTFNGYAFDAPPKPPVSEGLPATPSIGSVLCPNDAPVYQAVCAWKQRGVPARRLIIAAQGGGAYAAYHAALTMARLQDQCRGFSKNVLAFSGVSGGSLGIAVFLAAVDAVNKMEMKAFGNTQQDCNLSSKAPGQHEELVKIFFEADLLTPVITAGLLVDLPHHFLPYKSIPGIKKVPDRAKALEFAIIAAWQRVLNRIDQTAANFFELPLAQLNRDFDTGPVVFFGSMLAETGEPVVLSPMYFARHSPATHRILHIDDLLGRNSLSVAQAVVLSARFPLVTPAARVTLKSEVPGLTPVVSLLDGGVFENSGLKIARELHGAFLDSPLCAYDKSKPRPPCAYIPQFTMVSFSHAQDHPYRTDIFSEVMTPIFALLNAKTARGFDYAREVKSISGKENLEDLIEFELGDDIFSPPLGWVLSNATKKRIEARSGTTWPSSDAPSDKKAKAEHRAMQREHGTAMRVLSFIDTLQRLKIGVRWKQLYACLKLRPFKGFCRAAAAAAPRPSP